MNSIWKCNKKLRKQEQKLPFEIKMDSFDETVYEKLKEAELEMSNTTKRYSKEEILEKFSFK